MDTRAEGRKIYFSLDGTVPLCLEIHEEGITSKGTCKEQLGHAVANQQRRKRAEELLQAKDQGPNESFLWFVEDVLRLVDRADPLAQEKTKNFNILMGGVKQSTFGGFVRNPPATIEAFVKKATSIERAL